MRRCGFFKIQQIMRRISYRMANLFFKVLFYPSVFKEPFNQTKTNSEHMEKLVNPLTTTNSSLHSVALNSFMFFPQSPKYLSIIPMLCGFGTTRGDRIILEESSCSAKTKNGNGPEKFPFQLIPESFLSVSCRASNKSPPRVVSRADADRSSSPLIILVIHLHTFLCMSSLISLITGLYHRNNQLPNTDQNVTSFLFATHPQDGDEHPTNATR